MFVTVFLMALSAACELGVHAIPPKMIAFRRFAACAALLLLVVVSAVLLALNPNVFIAIIILFMSYRGFNLARLIKGRMHQAYVWQVSYRTTVALLVLQSGVLGLWWMQESTRVSPYGVLTGILLAQILAAFGMLRTVMGHAGRMRNISLTETIHDKDLPSVTIAIPARNETEALHECITSLLALHYPKLEILVLDDCSQSTRTPDIIKSFAHDGVRFIQGAEPSDTWLAKNQAYDTLLQAASGEWLLYVGVDIRLDPGSLRQLVAYAAQKQKKMVCVMPHNILYHGKWPLIQPMRYLWELALPRRAFDKPPVLSSCWLIERQSLVAAGGFWAASRMVVPEAYFAKQLLKSDGYSFLASGQALGVTSVKDAAEQRDTAVRAAYPQVHRRPEIVAVVTLGYIAWAATPLIVLGMALAELRLDALIAASMAVLGISCAVYGVVLKLAYGKVGATYALSLPFAMLVYVTLLNYSMYKYEFSQVLWKGRDICLPVMHVVPKLPRL